jgi:hypothetical protein
MAVRGSIVSIALSIAVAYSLYIVLGNNALSVGLHSIQLHASPSATEHRHVDIGDFHTKHQPPIIVAGVIPESPTTSQRHEEQRAILLAQLQSSRASVPGRKGSRYHLLKALYGFRRYEEVNFKEVERLEGLYAKVPSSQRKVSLVLLSV